MLFVNDVWLAPASWEPWQALFRGWGVESRAVAWPRTAAEHNRAPGVGFGEIVAAVAAEVDPSKETVVVGGGIAGLVAEKVLAQGAIAAAVTIAPLGITQVVAPGAPTARTGLFDAPFPALWRPSNIEAILGLTPDQFADHFGTHIERAESDALHERWSVAAPLRPLFQVRSAGYTRGQEIDEDRARFEQRPLLAIITSPHATAIGAASRGDDLRRRYDGTDVQLELVEYSDRGHSLTIDHGWRDIAETVLGWVRRSRATPPEL